MKRDWIYTAIIFATSFLLYAKTIFFYFSYMDDDEIILNNSAFFERAVDIHKIFTTDSSLEKQINYLYRPIQTLSYAIDTQLAGGIHSWMFHLTNVLLFALIGCSLYFLFRRFNIPDKIAFGGAILFAVHPMFTMPVSWIPARGDLFLTLFSILSMLFFIDFIRQKKYYQLAVSALFFLLALFSKETAAFLLFVFLLYFFCFQEKPRIEKKHVVFAIILFFGGLFWFYLRSISVTPEKTDISQKQLLNLPSALSQLVVFPLDFSPMPLFTVIKTVIGLLVFVFLLFLVFRKDGIPKKQKLFYLMWFVLLLSPIFFSPQPQELDYLDHRFLLPVIGIFLLLLSAFPKKWINRKIIVPFLIIVVTFSVISVIKSNVFKNPIKFYGEVIKYNPENILAYNNRGLYRKLINDGEGAMEDYNMAILHKKDFVLAYNNRGLLKEHNRDIPGALEDYNQAIFYRKDYFSVYNNRGSLKADMGDFQGALDDYNKAVSFKKDFAAAYMNRSILKAQMGDSAGAADDYNQAVFYDKEIDSKGIVKQQIENITNTIDDSKDAAFYNERGLEKGRKGDLSGAIKDFGFAIKLKSDYAEAYDNRAAAKGMLGDFQSALDDVNTAIKINPDFKNSYYNRANVYLMMKEYKKALQDCEKLLKMNPDDGSVIRLKETIISNIKN